MNRNLGVFITELRFDLNGMVELEKSFGGSLKSAVVRVAKGGRMVVAVEAFTRHLAQAPTRDEIGVMIQERGKGTVLRELRAGLVDSLTAGMPLQPEALPSRYQGMRANTAAIEQLQQEWPEHRQRQQAAYLRYATWLFLSDSHPGLTVEDVGREITPLLYHALHRAFEAALWRWAEEQEAAQGKGGV